MSVTQKPQPCGERTVLLRDLPLEQRLQAYAHLMSQGLTPEEAQELLAVVLEPEDKGGRVVS
mgnify:CR=1 FL=1